MPIREGDHSKTKPSLSGIRSGGLIARDRASDDLFAIYCRYNEKLMTEWPRDSGGINCPPTHIRCVNP